MSRGPFHFTRESAASGAQACADRNGRPAHVFARINPKDHEPPFVVSLHADPIEDGWRKVATMQPAPKATP
jgi:hypothetical protein